MEMESCTPGHLYDKQKVRPLFVLRWIGRSHNVAVNCEETDCGNPPLPTSVDDGQRFPTTAMPSSISSLFRHWQRLEAKLCPSERIVEAVSEIALQKMKLESTEKSTTCRSAKIPRKGVPGRRVLPVTEQRIPEEKISAAVALSNNQQSLTEKGFNGNGCRISYKRHAREMTIMRAYKLDMRYLLGRIFNNLAELASRDGLVAQPEDDAPDWSVMGQVGNAFRGSRGQCSKPEYNVSIVSGREAMKDSMVHSSKRGRKGANLKEHNNHPESFRVKANAINSYSHRGTSRALVEDFKCSAKRLKVDKGGCKRDLVKDRLPMKPLDRIAGKSKEPVAGVDRKLEDEKRLKGKRSATSCTLTRPAFKRQCEFKALEFLLPTKIIRHDASSESLGGVVSGECCSQVVEHDNCVANFSKSTATVFSHIDSEKLSEEDYSETSTVAELIDPPVCTKKVLDSASYPQAENDMLKPFSCMGGLEKNLNSNEGLRSHGQMLAVTIPSSMCSEGDSVEPYTPEVGLRNRKRGLLTVTAALRESASVSMEEAVKSLATSGLIPNVDIGRGEVLGGKELLFGHENQERRLVASVEQSCSRKEFVQEVKLWSSSETLMQGDSGAKVNRTMTFLERQGDGDGEIVGKGARRENKVYVVVPQPVEQHCGLPSTSSSAADHSDIVFDDRLNDTVMTGWQIGGLRSPGAVGSRKVAIRRDQRIALEDTKMLNYRNVHEEVKNSQPVLSDIEREKYSRRSNCARVALCSKDGRKHSDGAECLDIVKTAILDICVVDELSGTLRSRRNRSAPFWLVRDNIVAPLDSRRGPFNSLVDPDLVRSE